MEILLLIIGGVFLALIGLAYFFYYSLTKTKESLFGARQDLVRLKARHERTVEAARTAEAGWQLCLRHLEQSLGNTQDALSIGDQIGAVGQQLHELTTYIMHPLDDPQEIRRGRHVRLVENAASQEEMIA